jgi:very-short-patch-repair endonuclease
MDGKRQHAAQPRATIQGMHSVTIPTESLVFSRTLTVPADRAELYRTIRRGDLVRVSRGVYVAASLWNDAQSEERHRAAMRAVNVLRHGLVFGSTSAAILWGRPLLHRAPARPIGLRNTDSGGRSDANVTVRETATPFSIDRINGLQVTSLARSVVDAARILSFASAVAILDHAISPEVRSETWPTSARTALEEITGELDGGTHVGRGRARAAVSFADGCSGSPGESLSRTLMAECGFSRPSLQQAFFDRQGLIGYVDFWWPQVGVIGEFDGCGKYLRAEFMDGRTQAQVIADEKRREDRLRALGYTVVRWEWADLMHPERLRAKLARAGVRPFSFG